MVLSELQGLKLRVMSQDLWKSKSDWFAEWFNTEAYHALYQNRDLDEASQFTERITNQFFESKGERLMDLGCGKGRHAVSMAKMGHDVVGVDLSDRSISFAQSAYQSVEGLSFVRADMRTLGAHFKTDSFGGVLLLFTSFGYFEDDKDHDSVLTQINSLLQPGGLLVLDYFNLETVQNHLVAHEIIERVGWVFEIDRRIYNGWGEKSIRFVSTEGKTEHVLERVRAFAPSDLKLMSESAGFSPIGLFGNYQMEALVAGSPRCILVARK